MASGPDVAEKTVGLGDNAVKDSLPMIYDLLALASESYNYSQWKAVPIWQVESGGGD